MTFRVTTFNFATEFINCYWLESYYYKNIIIFFIKNCIFGHNLPTLWTQKMQSLFVHFWFYGWRHEFCLSYARESTNINDGFNFNTKTQHSSWFLTSCILSILFSFVRSLHRFVFCFFWAVLFAWMTHKKIMAILYLNYLRNVSSVDMNFGM